MPRRMLQMPTIWLAISILGTALLSITIFTALSDPFGFAGWPMRDSAAHPGRQDRDRFIKPWDIVIQQPETILLGSSRVKAAFNPDRAPKIFGRTYNAGIDGGTPSEIEDLLKFSTSYDSKLKIAIIELFFFHFVGPFFKGTDFTPHGLRFITDPVNAYLSPTAIRLSFQTLHNLARRKVIPQSVRRNGYIFKPLAQANGPNFVDGYNVAAKGLPDLVRLDLSMDALDEISNMHATCVFGKIRCIFFASPLGGVVLSCIERSHLWIVYANWLGRLGEYDSVANFSALGLDNLDGTMTHWADTGHFSEQTGDEIFRSLALDDYPRIDKTTISASSKALRNRILQWIAVNGAVVPDDSCPQ